MGRLIQNIGGGGGISSDEVTATRGDVLKGKTALTSDSNDEVVAGTLELTGNMVASDLLSGKTGYSTNPKSKITGTMMIAPTWPEELTASMMHFYGANTTSSHDGNNIYAKIPKGGYYPEGTWIGFSEPDLKPDNVRVGVVIGPGSPSVTGTYKGRGNATAEQVLTGRTFSTASLDNASGTMPNQGAKTASLNAGGSYTIPAGYHNGSGKVTANSLASQTGGATAVDSDVLSGRTYWKDGAKRTGTMSNRGAAGTSLNAGGSYTIPAGYHNGSGKVTANSLSSQTSATAAAGHILSGKTAWVNGSKITGTLSVQSAISFSAAARSYNTIRISWKNPSKGPWQGVFIQRSTSGNPGASGGTRVYTGAGNNPSQAGGSNYVDITGLSAGTTYYFTCTSYVNAIGNGSSHNVSSKTNDKTPDIIFSPHSPFAFIYWDGTNPRRVLADETSSPYHFLTRSGGITGKIDIVLRTRDFVIVYQYGNNSSHSPISQADLNILKTYKFKVCNSNGSTFFDYGQITSAVVVDVGFSTDNNVRYGVSFAGTNQITSEFISFNNKYLQFYK